MSYNIEIQGGSTVRLPTKGKYCDRDIVVTATGGENKLAMVFSCSQDPFEITENDIGEGNIVRTNFFEGNKGLIEFSSPHVTEVQDGAFCGCSNLRYANIPSVQTIGAYAFESCNKLFYVTTENAIEIGEYAFYRCTSLDEIRLDSVVSINKNAFMTCTRVHKVTIGERCTDIAASAFSTVGSTVGGYVCTFCGTTPPTVQTSTFGSNVLRIIVPKGCGETYKAATNWARFADLIEEAEE